MAERGGEAVNLVEVGRIIREMVQRGCDVFYVKHARDEMRNDEVNAVDVQHALKGCAVVDLRRKGADWAFTCNGRARDGRELEASVIVVDADQLRVITVYDRGKSRR